MMLLTNACVDDLAPGGDIVTSTQKEEVAKNQPEKIEAAVNGIFTQFSVYQLAVSSTFRHNDFGFGSSMLMFETDGQDAVMKNTGYNWYSGGLIYDNREYDSYESEIIWKNMYSQIFAANNLVATVGMTPKDDLSKFYLAQALATRAFDYLVLAQLYQFNYVNSKSKPCVPIITEKNSVEAAASGCARATVEEVYAQIKSDIDAAVKFLSESDHSRADNRYISLEVAYGIRARMNLAMANWKAAAADAAKAAAGSVALSAAEAGKPGFNDIKKFMWGIFIAETDRVVTSGIVNWASHMGVFNYGYAWYSGGIHINQKLYKDIPDTDVRKGWWLDAEAKSKNLNEAQAAMIAGYGIEPYVQVKFGPYKDVLETSTNATPICLMRAEEMLLIEAEGLAMSGDVAGGKAKLEAFIKGNRDAKYVCKASSPEALQAEIIKQRRIELWGEGLVWFDIMRLGLGIDRRGAGYPDPTSVLKIAGNDPVLLWRIPQGEIQANALINDADNNEATALPSPVPDVK